MGILNKNVRYKQLHCLYSKKTFRQLSPLKVSDPDLESFLSKADPAQYGTAAVNFKITNGVWEKTSCSPENLILQSQFLSEEQRSVLLPKK